MSTQTRCPKVIGRRLPLSTLLSYLFRVFYHKVLACLPCLSFKIGFWILKRFLLSSSSGGSLLFRTGAKRKGLPLALVGITSCDNQGCA